MTSILPLLLLAALPASALLSIFFLLRDVLERRRERWRQRFTDPDADNSPTEAARLAAAAPPPGWRGRFDTGFQQLVHGTGLAVSPDQVLGLMALTGVLLAGGLLVWRDEWWPALVGLAASVVVPLGLFRFLRARRRRVLQDQLPDAFFLLARSLRAGLTLEEALATVGEQGVRPLADEFGRCIGYYRLGLSAPMALQLMAQRLQMPDLNGLVAIVALHRTSGGNLPFLLDRWAATTRDRNQFRGYFRAATALATITAIALAAAPPLLLVGYWLLQPDYLFSFIRSSTGVLTLSIAGVLEVIGSAWVYYLARVDY
jgi:tight adherence protein B